MRLLWPLALLLTLGACAGGLPGSDPKLYEALADSDVELAARTMQSTLERAPDGATRSWANEQTGHRGSLTPIRTYVTESGYFCREYREELVIGADRGSFHQFACRDEDARWVWL
ncbi:MAG TPA: RT0821/Lpp0805 family surface protein [Geminicoccaceae bacterium]|nr:RT0821/Lpp0805 family surface protein [Geminicoccaceae bacterium]